MDNYRGLMIGEKAPSFTANTNLGPIRFPEDYKGKWVVFFSHPGDFTPVCTTELMTFASMKDQFEAINTQLVGLSVDSNPSHVAWIKAMEGYQWKNIKNPKVTYPIVADEMGTVAKLYGMLMPTASASRTVRDVFIIDPNGIIRAILIYPLTTGRNMKEILRLVEALQAYDKTGHPTPADWMPGEDQLYPAPSSAAEAEKNKKEPGAYCLDWYICFDGQGKNNLHQKEDTDRMHFNNGKTMNIDIHNDQPENTVSDAVAEQNIKIGFHYDGMDKKDEIQPLEIKEENNEELSEIMSAGPGIQGVMNMTGTPSERIHHRAEVGSQNRISGGTGLFDETGIPGRPVMPDNDDYGDLLDFQKNVVPNLQDEINEPGRPIMPEAPQSEQDPEAPQNPSRQIPVMPERPRSGAPERHEPPRETPREREHEHERESHGRRGRAFTIAEIALYNGRLGMPAYGVINGVVYDISPIIKLPGHGNLIPGTDMTRLFNTCHFGRSYLLDRLPVVGYIG